MDDVSESLTAFDRGDPAAASRLFLLVQAKLRRIAEIKLNREPPGQTLQPTALVNEVYLRIMGPNRVKGWDGCDHFLAEAVNLMQFILIDAARRKKATKHGGGRQRVELTDELIRVDYDLDQLLDLKAALAKFATVDSLAARVFSLRVLSGLSMEEVAVLLEIPVRTAYNNFEYAKTWLKRKLDEPRPPAES